MSTKEQHELIERIKHISNSKDFENEVSQIRAKTLLKEIGHNPEYSWKYVESRIVRNSSAASFMLEILSLNDVNLLKELGTSPLRLAFIWESLGRLGEKTSKDKALINAAVTYELAGFQANAACLARLVFKDLNNSDKFTVEKLSCLFLQRLFLQLRLFTDSLKKGQHDFVDKYDVIIASAFSLAQRGFTNASGYFLSGNIDLIKNAESDFIDCEKIFSDFGYVEEFNAIRSIRSLLPIMQKRSTWNILSDIVPNNPIWKRYLLLLSRGVGPYLLKSSSVSELWPSQIFALGKKLLDKHSKIIKMPTSAGKTRVAELSIVHTLVTMAGAKCIYIAPYRSLVWELERVFLNIFEDLGFRVSSVVGSYEMDDLEEQLILDADILVMTPEKLDLLQRAKSEFLNNVRLLIFDEGQIINEERRGIKFELMLSRLKRKLSRARFLFLSAVISNETLEQFARWLNTDSGNIIESQWRPSIQRYARFYWKRDTGFIRYDESEDNPLLKEFIPGVIRKTDYEFVNPKSGRINHKSFPEIQNKSQTAAELAYKFSEQGPVLVFCSQTNFVEAVAKSLQIRLTLTKNIREQLPEYFQMTRPSRSIRIAEDWLGNNHLVTQLLRDGIAIHHGNLPEVVRKAIEADFRDRIFRIMIATNTLAQGVNLPIRTVIIHTSRRRSQDGEWERIPDRDYWNIAGRAGRAGEETEGTVIHMTTTREDEEDFNYYLQRRNNLEPIKGALVKLLNDISEKRLSEQALRDKLDPEILALMAEESGEPDLQPVVEIINESLVKEQAERYHLDISHLFRVFRETADSIKTMAPKEYWNVYSSTGLSTTSCESLRAYISDNYENLHVLFKTTDSANLEILMRTILDVLRTLPEMLPDREYDGDYGELLIGWLNGKGVYTLSKEQGKSDSEYLAKFIEQFFSYLLPWGISAFIKIAMHVMKLEPNDVPDYVKFLPTMVKFGVPHPEASWAMSSGIPMRDLAIDISLKYKRETTISNHQNFLEWIGKINSETLQREFKLESPVLEDVSRSLFRSSINPYLKESRNVDDVLKDEFWVAGTRFEDRPMTAKGAKINELVELVRDYDNPVDRNAIRLLLNKKDLGFLDKQLAQLLAPYMDAGLALEGKIVKILHEKIPQIKIKIHTRTSLIF